MNPGAFKARVTRFRENARDFFNRPGFGMGLEPAFAGIPRNTSPFFRKTAPSELLNPNAGFMVEPSPFGGGPKTSTARVIGGDNVAASTTERTTRQVPIEVIVDVNDRIPKDFSKGHRPEKVFEHAVGEVRFDGGTLRPDFTFPKFPRTLLGFRQALESDRYDTTRFAIAVINATLPIDLVDALCTMLEKDIGRLVTTMSITVDVKDKLKIIEAIRAIGEFDQLKDVRMDGETKDKLLQRMMSALSKTLSLGGNATLKIEALEGMRKIRATSEDTSFDKKAEMYYHLGTGNSAEFTRGMEVALRDKDPSVRAMAAYAITMNDAAKKETNMELAGLLKEAVMREPAGSLGAMMLYASYVVSGNQHLKLEEIVENNHKFRAPGFVSTGEKGEQEYVWALMSGIAQAFPAGESAMIRRFYNVELLGRLALDEGVDQNVRRRCVECLGRVEQIGDIKNITTDELIYRVRVLSDISKSPVSGVSIDAITALRNLLDSLQNFVETVSYSDLRTHHAKTVRQFAVRLIKPEFGVPWMASMEKSG